MAASVLGQIYYSLEIRVWFNINFVLLVDVMSDTITVISHNSAQDLNLY